MGVVEMVVIIIIGRIIIALMVIAIMVVKVIFAMIVMNLTVGVVMMDVLPQELVLLPLRLLRKPMLTTGRVIKIIRRTIKEMLPVLVGMEIKRIIIIIIPIPHLTLPLRRRTVRFTVGSAIAGKRMDRKGRAYGMMRLTQMPI